MKKNKYVNYIIGALLIIILAVLSYFLIFKNDKKEVTKIDDILDTQYQLEKAYLKDLEDNKYKIDNPKIILNPYEISPLTAIILFETEEEEMATVTIEGKDDKTTLNHYFDKTKTHIIPIYGLYADYDNKVIINLENEFKEINIKTNKLPDDFVSSTSIYANKGKVNNDLIFVTPAMGGYTAAYDTNGEVRWYLVGNYAWDVQRLSNEHLMLSSNRPINPPYYTVGLVEIDLSGKIYKEYVLPGGVHHDVFEMEDGNLLVSSNDFNKGTVEDEIVLLNRKTGSIEKHWDLSEILPMEDGKSANWVVHDWFHNNSVWYDKNTNSITLSGRHQDAVINIDFDSGKLNWIIGNNNTWSEDMKKYFFKPTEKDFDWQWSQHAAMVLPNGNIFIFDNGNNRSKVQKEFVEANDNYSRGVIYNIDTKEMTIEQVWEYGKVRGGKFYSPYISDVDYFGDNHYLIHSGGIGEKDGKATNSPAAFVEGASLNSITVEVKNDEVILELHLPNNFYRAEKLSLYSSNNLLFGKGERLTSPNESIVESKKINTKTANEELDPFHKISFEKEIDRLIFKGHFKEQTKVYLILEGKKDQKVYNVPILKLPYTAMCINIFNEPSDDDSECDEIDVIHYVNEEGMSGKYNIYLSIDGKTYNTNQYVIFD